MTSARRIVLVTGGTRGVGKGIAEAFTAAGDDVFVCSRKPTGDALECDVRDPDSVAEVVAHVADAGGRLDVVVNNAGGARTPTPRR